MVVMLFASIQSAAAENNIYEKNGFSLEYPPKWKIKENWTYLKEVFFQAEPRSDSGIIIKHQKSIIPINTINDELIQFMIENERQNCRINKEGPCWNFEFTSAKTIAIDGSIAISLEYQATLDDNESIIKKIFIPDEDKNWLITIKMSKDKSDLFEEIEKSVETFARNKKTVNEVKISDITDSKIPKWVKNTMKWYIEGQISEKEMIVTLEFLIEQGIIKVNIPNMGVSN